MDSSDLDQFDSFVEKHWKKSINPEKTEKKAKASILTNNEEQPKRRGRKPKVEEE